jgi:hypothetical protein
MCACLLLWVYCVSHTLHYTHRYVVGLEGSLNEALEGAARRPPAYVPASAPRGSGGALLRAHFDGVNDFISFCGGPASFSGLVPRETAAALTLHALLESAESHCLLVPSAYQRASGAAAAPAAAAGDDAAGGGDAAFRSTLRAAIRTTNLRVMQLMPPACVYRLRTRLPRDYVSAYLDTQEHFSGAALLRGLARGEFVQSGLASRAPPRVVVLTRSCAELGVTSDGGAIAAALGYQRHAVLSDDLPAGGAGGDGGDGGGGGGGSAPGARQRRGHGPVTRRRARAAEGATGAPAAAGGGASAAAAGAAAAAGGAPAGAAPPPPSGATGTLHVIVLRDVPSSAACARLVDGFFAGAAAAAAAAAAAGGGDGGAVPPLPPFLLVLCDMGVCTFAQVTKARRCVDDAIGRGAAAWSGAGVLPVAVLLLHRPAAEMLLRPTYDAVSMGWDAVHVDAWDAAAAAAVDGEAAGGAGAAVAVTDERAWVRVMYGLAPALSEADARAEFTAGVEGALWRAVSSVCFGAARLGSLPPASLACLREARGVYNPATPPGAAQAAVLEALRARGYITDALVGVFAEYWRGFLDALGAAGARGGGGGSERPFLAAIRARQRWLLSDFMATVVRGALAAEWGLEALMRLPRGADAAVAAAADGGAGGGGGGGDPGVAVCVAALRALRVGADGAGGTARGVPCTGPSVPLTPLFVATMARLEDARRYARALSARGGMYGNNEAAAWRAALERPEWLPLRAVVDAVQASPLTWGAWLRDYVAVHLRFEVSSEPEWAVLRVAALAAVDPTCARDASGAPCDMLALCVARGDVRAAVQEVQVAARPLLLLLPPPPQGQGGGEGGAGALDDDAIARVTAGWQELRGGAVPVLRGRLMVEALRWAWVGAAAIHDCGGAAVWVRRVRDLRWAGPLFDGRTAALVCGGLDASMDAGGSVAAAAAWRRRCAVLVALFHVLCQSHVHDCSAYAASARAAGCLADDDDGPLPLPAALRCVVAASAGAGAAQHGREGAAARARIVAELLMWSVRRGAPDVAIGDVCDPAALARALLCAGGGAGGGGGDGDAAAWRLVSELPAPARVEAVAALLARADGEDGSSGDAEEFAAACEALLVAGLVAGGGGAPLAAAYVPACVLAVDCGGGGGGGGGAAAGPFAQRLRDEPRLRFAAPAAASAEVVFAAMEVAAGGGAGAGAAPRLARYRVLRSIAVAADAVRTLRRAAAALDAAALPAVGGGAASALGAELAASARAAIAHAPAHHGAYLLALLPLDAMKRVVAGEALLTQLGLAHLLLPRAVAAAGGGGGDGAAPRELAQLQLLVALLNARAGVSGVAAGTGFVSAAATALHVRPALEATAAAAAAEGAGGAGGGGGTLARASAGLAALLDPRTRAELALGEHIPLLASLVAFTRDALALRLTSSALGAPLDTELARLPDEAAATGRALLARFHPAWRAMRAAFTTFEQCPRELAAAAGIPEFAVPSDLCVLHVVEPPAEEGEVQSAPVSRMLRDRFVAQQARVLDPEASTSACAAFADAEFNRHEWLAPAAPPPPQSRAALPAHGPDARARVLTGGFASDDVDGAAAAREIDSLVRGALVAVVEEPDARAGAAAAAAAVRMGGEAAAARARTLVDAEARALQARYASAAEQWSVCPACHEIWDYADGCNVMRCGSNAHDNRVGRQGCGATYDRPTNRGPAPSAGAPPLRQFVDMARHAAEGAMRGLEAELGNIAPLRGTRWEVDAVALAQALLPRVLGGRVAFGGVRDPHTGLIVDPFFR